MPRKGCSMRLRSPISPSHATQREAIAYLASVCDGAIRRDGHGFSADHVELGHKLANSRWWGPLARRRAQCLIRVHGSQLRRAGFSTHCLLSRATPPQRRSSEIPGCFPSPRRQPHEQGGHRQGNGRPRSDKVQLGAKRLQASCEGISIQP